MLLCSGNRKINYSMKTWLVIGTGSFIGGVFRYLLPQFVQNKTHIVFPFGTLGVNIIGCLLIGIVFGISEKGNMNTEWRLFLATGVLGGFTTFSAFSLETVVMIRDGQSLSAFAYIALSVIIGVAATFGGILLTKYL